MSACEPRGYRFEPVVQDVASYSFVREHSTTPEDYVWDRDKEILRALALSRLIRPTSTSLAYAARVELDTNDEVLRVIPPGNLGMHGAAYIADTSRQNWLSENDGMSLGALIRAYEGAKIPDRVRRAIWNHEYAAYQFEVEIRWTIVVTALEALIHTSKRDSSRQFCVRVSKMATELGVKTFGESEAREAYELRCALSHGERLSVGVSASPLYCEMETVLRLSLLKSIEDPSFASVFDQANSIEARWPIPSTRAS